MVFPKIIIPLLLLMCSQVFAASGAYFKAKTSIHRVFKNHENQIQWDIGTGSVGENVSPWISVTLNNADSLKFRKILFKKVFGRRLDLATVSSSTTQRVVNKLLSGTITPQMLERELKVQNVTGLQTATLVQLIQSIEGKEYTYLNRKGDIYLRAATEALVDDHTRQSHLIAEAWKVVFPEIKRRWQQDGGRTVAGLDTLTKKYIASIYKAWGAEFDDEARPDNMIITALMAAIAGDTIRDQMSAITVVRDTVPMEIVFTYFGLHLQKESELHVFKTSEGRYGATPPSEVTSYSDELRKYKDFKDVVKDKTLVLFHTRRYSRGNHFPDYKDLVLVQPRRYDRAWGNSFVRNAVGPTESFRMCFGFKTSLGMNKPCESKSMDGLRGFVYGDVVRKLSDRGQPQLKGLAPMFKN